MITKEQFKAVADLLKCEPATVQAVAKTESNGSGFLPDGRPTILFEAHLFRSATGGIYDLTHPTISCTYNDPKRTQYYRLPQWDRMKEAVTLNAEAAYRSASWGAFQILGSNYAACGCESVFRFVEYMATDELHQLTIFANFVTASPKLLSAIRSNSWADFAMTYNGRDYESNKYDIKLAAAYANYKEGDV